YNKLKHGLYPKKLRYSDKPNPPLWKDYDLIKTMEAIVKAEDQGYILEDDLIKAIGSEQVDSLVDYNFLHCRPTPLFANDIDSPDDEIILTAMNQPSKSDVQQVTDDLNMQDCSVSESNANASIDDSSLQDSVSELVDSVNSMPRGTLKRHRDNSEEATQDILNTNTEIDCSETEKQIYIQLYPDSDLIDLRLKSQFLQQLSPDTRLVYLDEMDSRTESLIPQKIHEFLVTFFSQNLSSSEWQLQVDDLCCPDSNDELMVATLRILRRTLPIFIKAFSLGPANPLQDLTSIEKTHLNAFIHPYLEAALWHIATINYMAGEIPSWNHVNRECSDGAGFMTTADKFELIYVEGARLDAKADKEIADAKKIGRNLRKMYVHIVKEHVHA
ncbi:5006_t:CDS:2, partial [Paraglomus brasilianum]